ncbi:MAG: PEGA domain-containing protein, partial [Pseudomonadota bacterium]|nr:PEGA domain-containing protein [Pseudomonadota bacterium]
QGALTYPDGRSYEGEFSNGEFHGKGSEVFADGKKYDGQYMEGKFHGKGLLRNPNGSSIEATFRHGEPYGQVRLTTAAGEVFTARTTEPGVCYREKSYRATQCPQLEGW